jgi:hypothetical protein
VQKRSDVDRLAVHNRMLALNDSHIDIRERHCGAR